jgi:hypothetical protein
MTDWLNYLFPVDFSDQQSVLSAFPTGVVSEAIATQLAASLSTHDTGEGRALWTDQAGAQWSLAGVTVTYNGHNKTSLPTNGLMTHVLVIQFPSTSVQPPAGTRLYLQYNVPGATSFISKTLAAQSAS